MPERMTPPPDLAGLSLPEILALVEAKTLPPVENWNPTHCGDSEMRIARDGTWYHQGSPIGRPAMVRLFSTVLRREPDGSHVLVTPVEKLSIEVEDTPFRAVEVRSEGEGRGRKLAFRLDSGDIVVAGPAHGLRIEESGEGPQPFLQVRGGLEARLVRTVFYELAEIAIAEGADPPGVWSDGIFLPLATA